MFYFYLKNIYKKGKEFDLDYKYIYRYIIVNVTIKINKKQFF